MRTRRLRIEWQPGRKVGGLLAMPAEPVGLGVVLAHGAGAGQRHPFMAALRTGLARMGFPTLTFDYPYIEEGRRAPDRFPRLLEAHRAAADRMTTYADHIVLAGKSMGGRVGSHLAGDEDWPAAALVYLGYPLVPGGSRPPRSTEHLAAITAPQLFWCGTRDRLSPPALVGPLADRLPHARLRIVEQADHGFHVLKRSGLTDADVLARLAADTAAWLAALQNPTGGR